MIGSEVELKWNRKDLESLKSVVEKFVTHKRVAVQAGACYGVFPIYLATKFSAVYTFEPDPDLFRSMVINVLAPNVIKMQAALGNQRVLVRTECSLRHNDGKSVAHEGMTRTEPGGLVPTIRIDDLGLEYCDLIYLDVEGDEMAALAGARETIVRFQPVVVCEINRGIEYRGFTREDVFTRLRILGYDHAASFRSDEVFVFPSKR